MALTAEELEARRDGIGGSDVAAILGLDKWRGPLAVYLSKIGEGENSTSIAGRRGNHLESFAAELYAEETGLALSEPGTFRGKGDQSWRLANVDRLAFVNGDSRPNRVVECKCPTSRTYHEWGEAPDGRVPESYLVQCTWYMDVTGIHRCDLVALLDDEIRIYPVEWDDEFAAMLRERAERFRVDHVLARNPPPPDGTWASKLYLEKRFPRSRGNMLEATPELRTLGAQIVAARERLKQATEEEAALCNQLKAQIGDADGVDGLATWRTTKSGGVDYPALVKELGVERDTLERFKRPGFRRFVFLKGDEK
jgi:putative phage-type endonuclease